MMHQFYFFFTRPSAVTRSEPDQTEKVASGGDKEEGGKNNNTRFGLSGDQLTGDVKRGEDRTSTPVDESQPTEEGIFINKVKT